MAGATGVSVDAEGHPITVLTWCEGATPEGVHISHNADVDVDDVTLIAPRLDGQAGSVRLDMPQNGWKVEPKPFTLREKVLYHAFAIRDGA
ncbi:hypothetical protein AB0K18_38185 [Nonomuraea sp. NPDC049421]|uniref:hypothetical protein n=1 Tax=Nonomuraea sp. NPDC049421 TaxID=3155275 RepID=UPI00342B873E